MILHGLRRCHLFGDEVISEKARSSTERKSTLQFNLVAVPADMYCGVAKSVLGKQTMQQRSQHHLLEECTASAVAVISSKSATRSLKSKRVIQYSLPPSAAELFLLPPCSPKQLAPLASDMGAGAEAPHRDVPSSSLKCSMQRPREIAPRRTSKAALHRPVLIRPMAIEEG